MGNMEQKRRRRVDHLTAELNDLEMVRATRQSPHLKRNRKPVTRIERRIARIKNRELPKARRNAK